MKLVIIYRITTLVSSFLCVFSYSAILGQDVPRQLAASRMPDEFQLSYHVRLKICISEAEQRKEYEKEAAYAKEMQATNKYVLVPGPFPGVPPDREFGIKIAQRGERFYWASDEKSYPVNFIYDGKRTYFYDPTSHRMSVYGGFKLINGMTVPLPGRGFAHLPLLMHASASTPLRIDGEVYAENFDDQGKPSYMPGRVDLNTAHPTQIDSAIAYNGTKKYHEYLFHGYSTSDGLAVPKEIIGNLYNQQTKGKEDALFLQSKYRLESFSLSSPPEGVFDPINLLNREQESGKASPEFVQWYYDNGREITFTYKPGKSLEEQAGIIDYQLKKAVSRVENGKVDPRNYVGLALLLFLVVVMGWKVTHALKSRRNG